MKRIWKFIWPYLRNKYIVSILAFVIWIVFFNQYNLINRVRLAKNINELKQEKAYYQEQIRKDSLRLHELTTDDQNLEKFAREQYYMKKANEDVYIVVDPEE